ncbi:MAG TPA: IS200/IS605 family transposase [Bacteroidia bacterium]|nr:IS200/IS605 family transposase [Bacteroidia bacterium]
MANTYTKVYIHVVFAVKFRAALIHPNWKIRLLKFTTGIIEKNEQHTMRINCVEDHMHILIGLNTKMTLAELMRDIKANSSRFINEQRFTPVRFEWQRGFGAFSVNPRDVQVVSEYIENQEEHHQKKIFREEYIELLNENEVEYDAEYIFEEPCSAPTGLR